MKKTWNHNRRFNAYANFFKEHFGERIQKVAIDAGFTCPNRDGHKGKSGCAFCNNSAFNPSYCSPEKSITTQINDGILFHKNRYRRAKKYLAYFQAYSNTYAPVERLRALYDEALRHPAIVGLVIGTRPDCVDEEKLSYFQEIAKTKFIALEYGIESCYNNTLKKINRGHTFEEAVEAVNMTNAHGLHCGAHFILGLPFETEDMMLDSAAIISELPINTVKFHQLQILRDTTFEQMYLQDPSHFKFFTFEEYVSFFIKFLERLNPEIIVERFSGEVPPRYLVNPGWGLIRNDQVIIAIEKEMQTQNTWQGKKYKHI